MTTSEIAFLALGLGRATCDDLLFPRWDGKVRSPHWLTQKFALAMAALKIKGGHLSQPAAYSCLATDRLRHGPGYH